MSWLSQLGTLSYHGVGFREMHSSKISNKVVYDDSGRVVKWQEVTIEVQATIDVSDAPDVNEGIANLWNSLTEPGAELIYTDKGFGEFRVNSDNDPNVRDLNWGPKPEMVSFTPIGGNRVVLVSWKVTAHVLSCPNGSYKNHLFNFTFEVGFDHDSDGYLTTNITGSYEIPLTFATNDGAHGPLTVTDTADEWWGRVCPVVKTGFQRVTKSRKVSRDRRQVSFNVTDRELPVPLPNDVTFMEVKHKVRSENMGFYTWTNTISGTVRVNPQLQRITAWDRFTLVLFSRILWAQSNIQGILDGPITVILMSLEWEEDVFGKDARFSCTYRLLGVPIKWILQQSGLWLHVPATSHASWTASMVNGGIHGAYGRNKAMLKGRDDVMIDLCHSEKPSPQVPSPADTNYGRTPLLSPSDHAKVAATHKSYVPPKRVNPANSWLSYQSDLEFGSDDNIIRHKPLAGRVEEKNPHAAANGAVSGVKNDVQPEFLLTNWDTPDILQQVCSPDTDVVLVGRAARYGYRINPPRLAKFGGKDITQGKAQIQERLLGNVEGIPIWGLWWRIEYMLTEPAARTTELAHPEFQRDGGDGRLRFGQAIPRVM